MTTVTTSLTGCVRYKHLDLYSSARPFAFYSHKHFTEFENRKDAMLFKLVFG